MNIADINPFSGGDATCKRMGWHAGVWEGACTRCGHEMRDGDLYRLFWEKGIKVFRCANSAVDVTSNGVPPSTNHIKKVASALVNSAIVNAVASFSAITTTLDHSSKKENNNMAATLPAVPALPDEQELTNQVSKRPDWVALNEQVEGVDGKELFESGQLGEKVMQSITGADTAVKDYLPEFLDWYWDSHFGKVEKAGAAFRDMLRLAEEKRCKTFRAEASRISGQFIGARNAAIAAEKARIERQQREQAERERLAEVARLEAERLASAPEQAAEIAQQIEETKATPIIPTAVSTQQASLNLSKAPAKVSGTPVMFRHVTSLRALFEFLSTEKGSAYIGTICRIIRDPKGGNDEIAISFAKLKSDLETAIPGLTNHKGTTVSNRG